MRRATSFFIAQNQNIKISIHALLAESDVNGVGLIKHIGGFLSTLSLRRATVLALCSCGGVFDFYPRSPCGERQFYRQLIHHQSKFLSTLSLRRATSRIFLDLTFHKHFYPRSPCGERQNATRQVTQTCHFYPRSPCGERPQCRL